MWFWYIYIYITFYIRKFAKRRGTVDYPKLDQSVTLGSSVLSTRMNDSTKSQWSSHFFLGRNCETSWSLELLKDLCFWPATLGKENTILWGSKRERNHLFYFPSWNKQEVEWNCWKGGTCNSDKKEWKINEMDCTLWLDGVLGQDCQRRTYRPDGVSSRL